MVKYEHLNKFYLATAQCLITILEHFYTYNKVFSLKKNIK